MTYTPRPGSGASDAVRHLRAAGRWVRMPELAASIGISVKAISSVLAVPLKHGLIERRRAACGRAQEVSAAGGLDRHEGSHYPSNLQRPRRARPSASIESEGAQHDGA